MEVMELQQFLNLIVGIVLAAGGWFAREVWVAVRELRKDLHKLEVGLPTSYVSKDEFTNTMRDLKKDMKDLKDEISRGFERLHDRLDGKEDKR